MAKKRLAPHRGPYTEGRFHAVKDEKHTYPWRVVARDIVVAVIQSGRPRADCERIVACLNVMEDVSTREILDGSVTRLWLAARHMADLLEGVELPVPDRAAFQHLVLKQARAALAVVGRRREDEG